MTTEMPALVDRQRVNAAADEWNRLHPVGTPVVAYPGVRPEEFPTIAKRLETTTRSVAWMLGGEPVVMVHGYAGGIALSHIDLRAHAMPGELAEYRHLLIDADTDATTRPFVDLRKGRKL
jgi:hypothetical protein